MALCPPFSTSPPSFNIYKSLLLQDRFVDANDTSNGRSGEDALIGTWDVLIHSRDGKVLEKAQKSGMLCVNDIRYKRF